MAVKHGRVDVDDTYMDYVSFGKGKKYLIIIPGLSTRGIRGAELSIAYMYRIFAKEYKVYFFDRKHEVEEGYSVFDIANDTVRVMRKLGIKKTSVFGVSQGGMIAQIIAAFHPEMVEKLVLGVTLSKQNDTVKRVVNRWIEYAKQKDYQSLNRETLTMLYSEKYLKKNALLLPIFVRMVKPENLKKFVILANACLSFDGYENLDKIKCPVLVLGGRKDKVVTGQASEEIAGKLKCEVYMYEELGHAAYHEAKDFNQRIYDFLKK
ncbi:MAG: alpha/beta hydrolase [Lachnospiraceae bacterium]|nr:alpha/beta hydrolase [Lachnospiraceae bacterium]